MSWYMFWSYGHHNRLFQLLQMVVLAVSIKMSAGNVLGGADINLPSQAGHLIHSARGEQILSVFYWSQILLDLLPWLKSSSLQLLADLVHITTGVRQESHACNCSFSASDWGQFFLAVMLPPSPRWCNHWSTAWCWGVPVLQQDIEAGKYTPCSQPHLHCPLLP